MRKIIARQLRQLALAVTAGSLALLATAPPAAAQYLLRELKLGVLSHDVPELWSGFRAERGTADLNMELILQPSLPFLFGRIHPAIGGTLNWRGDTSHAYIDARWEVETPVGLFFALGLGAAVHNGDLHLVRTDAKALGTRLLFHVPAEVGVRLTSKSSVSIYFEHTSNGGASRFNEGLDRLGLRYGYRF